MMQVLICVASITIIGGRAVAQQGSKAPADGTAVKDRGGPPPNLKLSPEAKKWFDPAVRPLVSVGKRSIDVLEDDATTDDDLAALRYLPEVDRLYLERCFTANGLAALKGLPNIESLRLESAIEMTDEELEGLATMPNLRELRIVQEGSSILSDRGLRALRRLPHLQILELTNANISEEGVRSLNEFPELRKFSLTNATMTWASRIPFPKLGQLQTLTRSWTSRQGRAIVAPAKAK